MFAPERSVFRGKRCASEHCFEGLEGSSDGLADPIHDRVGRELEPDRKLAKARDVDRAKRDDPLEWVSFQWERKSRIAQ
jgi:hypothetical protein